MKVTNRTAYATIGCDVQLSENDRLALGVELDKVTNWLETAIFPPEEAEANKAINKIVVFVSKFAIRPSLSNVFTGDSIEEFKKVEETDNTTTTVEQPASEDNIITVGIPKNRNLMNLAKIIYQATDASLSDINELFNSAEESHLPRISFECTIESKGKVLNWLRNNGYKIVPNTAGSLHLDTH